MTNFSRMFLIGLAMALVLRPLGAQMPGPDQFVPLVDIKDTVAHCEKVFDGAMRPGETGFLLRFGKVDTLQRVVSAVWDSVGQFVRYSDARGDLRGLPVAVADRGPRTTIIIDMAKGFALLLNETHGRTRGSSMATAGATLDARNLGPPRQLLERLHRQCGAPETHGPK